jgi:hypothetical protein
MLLDGGAHDQIRLVVRCSLRWFWKIRKSSPRFHRKVTDQCHFTLTIKRCKSETSCLSDNAKYRFGVWAAGLLVSSGAISIKG